jgi:hypothetical protein
LYSELGPFRAIIQGSCRATGANPHRTIVFASDEERAQYAEWLELWTRDSDPSDMIEAALSKQIVDSQWRLQQISPWESAAVPARRRS